MIEQLPQRPALMRSPSLRPIHSIKSLIQKEPNGPRSVHPSWHILIERRVVPEEGQEIHDDEAEAGERDGIRCHGHGEAFYDDVVVEGFEDVFRDEGVVDAGVFVLFEAFEALCPYVDHFGDQWVLLWPVECLVGCKAFGGEFEECALLSALSQQTRFHGSTR